jgi:hypothetical protein
MRSGGPCCAVLSGMLRVRVKIMGLIIITAG